MIHTPEDCLKHYWGYDSFRPVQRDIVESVLQGNDTIGLLPTGGGKSITFQVPALMMEGVTLVITPLISLMKDQVDNLREIDVPATCLYSGLTRAQQQLACDRARLGKVKLIYMSPERATRDNFAAELQQWPVSMIVVDEAHCISQWGYDFRPNYLKLDRLRKMFPDAPVMALTASATPEVVRDIAAKLDMRSPLTFSRSFARTNISYLVRHTSEKEDEMIRIIERTRGTAIVYVRSRAKTNLLAEVLRKRGITADSYHAGLQPEDKVKRQDSWKNNEIRVMVATNAFGMGIDKPDVRLVIHYDLPSSLEEYYQEAGRAGRDGKESYAVMLASQSDKALLARRLSDSFPPKDEIVRIYDSLGVWLNVSVDGGFNQVYDFSFDNFCHHYKFQATRVRSALGILGLAGYIEFVEDLFSQARVMLLMDRSELYDLVLDPKVENILQHLLRLYPGLFSDYVPVSEERLALKAGCSPQDVYEALLQLSRQHVLHYIPRRLVPYVYYRQRRQLPRYIMLPLEVYEHRRKRAAERLDALRQYVFDNSSCPVRRMLAYFGDSEANDCGKCDYCRNKREVKLEPLDPQTVLDDVRNVLEAVGSPLRVSTVSERYGKRSEEVIEIIRILGARGDINLIGRVIYG